jgi:hypothetical protein
MLTFQAINHGHLNTALILTAGVKVVSEIVTLHKTSETDSLGQARFNKGDLLFSKS